MNTSLRFCTLILSSFFLSGCLMRGGVAPVDFSIHQKAGGSAASQSHYTYQNSVPPKQTVLFGDWNGNGLKEIGIHVGRSFYLDMNGNRRWDPNIDVRKDFGIVGDRPLVGDWNGDGRDQIGVHRVRSFYLEDGNGSYTRTQFGIEGDFPIIGDWDGDGTDQIGVYRNGFFFLDNGDGVWGSQDVRYGFGNPGDKPVAGDWNRDGKDEIGVHDGQHVRLDINANFVWDTGDYLYPPGQFVEVTPTPGEVIENGAFPVGSWSKRVNTGNPKYVIDHRLSIDADGNCTYFYDYNDGWAWSSQSDTCQIAGGVLTAGIEFSHVNNPVKDTKYCNLEIGIEFFGDSVELSGGSLSCSYAATGAVDPTFNCDTGYYKIPDCGTYLPD